MIKYTRLLLESCSFANVQCSPRVRSFSAEKPNTRRISGQRYNCTRDSGVLPFQSEHPSAYRDSKSCRLLPVRAATDHTPFPSFRNGSAYVSSSSTKEPSPAGDHISMVIDFPPSSAKKSPSCMILLSSSSKECGRWAEGCSVSVCGLAMMWVNSTIPWGRQNQLLIKEWDCVCWWFSERVSRQCSFSGWPCVRMRLDYVLVLLLTLMGLACGCEMTFSLPLQLLQS